MSTRRTRRVTKNGISWVETVPWTPPPIDAPLLPLTHAAPEVPLRLYDGDPHHDAERRRRHVDTLLEKHGLRPRNTW